MAQQLQPPPQPPKQSAANLLGAPHPKATRYKRGLVMGLALGSVAFAGAAMFYGIFDTNPHRSSAGAVADDTTPRTQANSEFGLFPTGYAALTAPKPVPTSTAAQQPLTPHGSQPQGPPMGGSLDDSREAREEREDAREAAQSAAASDIFFSNTTDPAVQSEIAAQQGGQPPSLASLLAGAQAAQARGPADAGSQQSTVPSDADQGLQGQKNSFVAGNSQAATDDYTNSPVQTPLSKYEVQAGSVIPAALVTGVNSDLPGDLTARVTRPVYDSATGNYLLIPQGALLYGKYDSLVSYGQTRALVVWNRIIFPNGNSINLGGMIGTDATGESGLQDQVNRHIPAFLGALAAATLLSIGPSLALNLTQPSGGGGSTNVFTDPAQTLGQNTANIGQELISKALNRPNTITIRQGWPLRVLVNKDMILAPYSS